MAGVIFGWIGSQDIYNFLKNEFNEQDMKKIYNILFFKIETKDIKYNNTGMNQDTIDKYYELKKKDKNDDNNKDIKDIKDKNDKLIKNYQSKYSAYNKILSMYKYLNIINLKYGVNLKINFHHYLSKDTFVLYFGEFLENINVSKMMEYLNTWDRLKKKFDIEPKIHYITNVGYITKFVKFEKNKNDNNLKNNSIHINDEDDYIIDTLP